MQFTSKQAFAGQKAADQLNPVAFAYYKSLFPFWLYEYSTPDGIRYAYTGIIGEKNNLTFDGLQYIFEELARLTAETPDNQDDESPPEQLILQFT